MEGHLHEFCFLCGQSATAAVEIGGCMIGVWSRMGPNKERCIDKMRNILSRSGSVVVKETVVQTVGG
jgi:hypothetical protein